MDMKVPDYVFIDSSETKGKILILCTQSPYIVAQVWMFKTPEEHIAFMNECKVPGVIQIAEYRIVIVYVTTLFYVQHHFLVRDYLPAQIPGMAKFFLEERIRPHEPLYKKYKITD